MKYKITYLLALSLFIASCNDNSNNKSAKDETTLEEHNHEEENIELNNGNKWEVDEKMIIHIRNMENDVVQFSTSDQKDYKSLASKLQENINLLTASCTMTGKAHDELHKWLVPYMEEIEALSSAENENEASKTFNKIQEAFNEFNHFFQ